MSQLTTLIKEQFYLLKSHASSLVLLMLVPLFLGMIVGAVLNTGSNSISVGAVMLNPDAPSGILDEIQSKGAKITFYSNPEFCSDKVVAGAVDACLLIDESSNLDIVVDYEQGLEVTETVFALSSTIGSTNENYQREYADVLTSKIEVIQEAVKETLPIISQLTTKYQKLSEMLDDFKIQLQSINVHTAVTPPDSTGLIDQKKKFERSMQSLDTLKGEMTQSFRQTKEAVERIVSDTAISEVDKITIEEELEKGQQEIQDIAADFRISRDLSVQDVAELQATVETMITNLEALDQELNKFEELQIDSGIQVRSAQELLAESLSDLLMIQKMFNSINAGIPPVTVSGINAAVTTKITPVVAKEKSRTSFWFIGIFSLFVMLTSILLSVGLVGALERSEVSQRRRLAPIMAHTRIASICASTAGLVILQGLFLLFGWAMFASSPVSILLVIVGSLLGAICFGAIGGAIRHYFNDDAALGMTLAVCSGFVLFSEMTLGSFAKNLIFNPFQMLLQFIRSGNNVFAFFILTIIIFLLSSYLVWRKNEAIIKH